MKNSNQDQLVLSDGEKILGTQSVETVSVSNKDLLQLEQRTSMLEKRLLMCTNGEDLMNSWSLKKRVPLTTCPMPESNVLKRLKSFLPTFNQANCKLFSDIQARGADEFNIEVLTETGDRYVEMDLALGVADLRTPESLAGAELAANGQVLKAVKSEDSSECNSDSDDDENSRRIEVMRSRRSRQISGCDLQARHNDKPEIRPKKIELL